jgi:excisionase family DNA binding protein
LTRAVLLGLLGRTLVVQGVILGRLFGALATDADGALAATSDDRLLSVSEAAERLGLSRDRLYRHATRFPFVVRVGRSVRFSSQGIDRYIRQRSGR